MAKIKINSGEYVYEIVGYLFTAKIGDRRHKFAYSSNKDGSMNITHVKSGLRFAEASTSQINAALGNRKSVAIRAIAARIEGKNPDEVNAKLDAAPEI